MGSHIAALAACAAVNGAAAAFSRPAVSGLVPQIVGADRLQQANGLLGLTPRLIGIAGAALGAWLIEAVGAGYALALDSASFLVAGLLMLTLARSATRASRGTSPLADLGEGWREVRSRTWLWAMILSFGAFQLAYFPALTVLGPEIARRSLGGAPAWAVVITGELIGGIVGGVIAVRTRSSRPLRPDVRGRDADRRPADGPGVRLAARRDRGERGGRRSGARDVRRRLVHDPAAADPRRGASRVSSFDWLGSMALNPLGYALIGPLAALVGTRATMGGAAVLLWVAGLAPLAVPAVLNLRLPPAGPAPAPAPAPAQEQEPEQEEIR